MTVKVLEQDGIYTAYRLVMKRGDDGTLREAAKHIDIPLPPPSGDWTGWAAALTEDELEVGLQVFYDKWNFGRGAQGDHAIYTILHRERVIRRDRGDTFSSRAIQSIKPSTELSEKPPAPKKSKSKSS